MSGESADLRVRHNVGRSGSPVSQHGCTLSAFFLAFLGLAPTVHAAPVPSQVPPGAEQVPAEEQFVETLQLLPEESRPGATLMIQALEGETVVREGINPYICVGDLPGDDRFSVTCYHESLHSVLARERELTRLGVGPEELRATMEKEIDSGELTLPDRAHQIAMSGPLDPDTGLPAELAVTHLFYIPFATEEEVGLVDRPDQSTWLHRAGSYDAHIMWSGPTRMFGRDG